MIWDGESMYVLLRVAEIKILLCIHIFFKKNRTLEKKEKNIFILIKKL